MADLAVPSGIIPSADASILILNAAVTIAAGETVYLDTSVSPNVLRLCDANANATASVFGGLACNSATVGQKVRYVYKDPALYLGSTMAVGDTLWTSGTAGRMTLTPGDIASGWYVTAVGVCSIVNSTINFNPTAAGAAKV